MNEEMAFPINTTGNMEPSAGMTLRDYFAAHALQGAMQKHPTDRGSKTIAGYAYWIADAMMEARAALREKE